LRPPARRDAHLATQPQLGLLSQQRFRFGAPHSGCADAHEPDLKNPAAIAPLASLTFSVRLSEQWTVRTVFDRVTTSYNRDSDIFLLGLGYRWGR
jgi:hypothetical protein